MQNRVFVTKISSELREADVKQYFEGFGAVHDFYMPLSKDGLTHKGMAFLSYGDAVDKELILQNAPHSVLGHEVIVDDARPQEARLRNGEASWGEYDKGGGKSGHTTSRKNDESNRVFVTRIAEELTKEDLEAYFCQFGELTDIFVPLKNPNGDLKDAQHKGIAFVSFKERDTYDEVLSRDKYEIKPNIFIVVDKAAGKEPRYGKGKGKWGMPAKGKGKYGKAWDYPCYDWDWWHPYDRREARGAFHDRWVPY